MGIVTGPVSFQTIKTDHMYEHSSLKAGIIGGTLLTILGAIAWVEIERTLVLGSIGAAVSYLVSFILRKLTRKWISKD